MGHWITFAVLWGETPFEAGRSRPSRLFSRRNKKKAASEDAAFRFIDLTWRLCLQPFGMERARLVDALVGVRAEVVALRLQ
jgi:hypothetical protein